MDHKDKLSLSVAFIVFMCIGLWAVLSPDQMEGYAAFGRFAGAKQLVADNWGRPLGLGMIATGALALVGLRGSGDP